MALTIARGKNDSRNLRISNLLATVLLGLCLGVLALASPGLAASETFRLVVAETASEDAAIAGFYAAHDYATLWTGAGDAARRSAFFQALDNVDKHGLPAARYDAAGLRAAFAAVASEHQRAKLEVMVTKAFLTYARDVQTGFLTPAEIDPGIVRDVPRRDPRATLDSFAAADPAAFLRGLPPSAPQSGELQRARLDLAAAIAAGGWGAKVAVDRLEPGDSGSDVVVLRDRLVAQGYLNASVTQTFDTQIQRAVQVFQGDHGLTPDGVAGAGTIGEINRAPEERLKSVLWRWNACAG